MLQRVHARARPAALAVALLLASRSARALDPSTCDCSASDPEIRRLEQARDDAEAEALKLPQGTAAPTAETRTRFRDAIVHAAEDPRLEQARVDWQSATLQLDIARADRDACFARCEARVRVSALVGPVVNVSGDQHTQMAFGAQIAVPFGDGTHFVVAAAEAQVGGGYESYLFPVGFQQDVAIADAPVHAYLRTSVGYAAQVLGGTLGTTDNLLLLPEAGVRWNVTERLTLGADPFSFPVMASRFGSNVTWRLVAYAGYSL